MRAAQVCEDFLAKGRGAGSRGGQVIGHTSSGRAIYAHRASGGAVYAVFSAADHLDAAREHLGRVGLLNHRARGNPQRTPVTPNEQAMVARAARHMTHYMGHVRHAKRLDAAVTADQRLEALA